MNDQEKILNKIRKLEAQIERSTRRIEELQAYIDNPFPACPMDCPHCYHIMMQKSLKLDTIEFYKELIQEDTTRINKYKVKLDRI